jgi:ribosomal protein L11 methylase PrmA
MAWISLKIEAHDNTAELISDTLMDLGALSTIIEDANAETPDEQPILANQEIHRLASGSKTSSAPYSTMILMSLP